jgi:protein-disulfide isomerase
VPIALGGVLFFAAATLLAWRAARRDDTARRMAGYLFAATVPALSVVLYLGYASFFVLKTYCIFCLVTYLAVIAVFLITGAAADGTMTQLPKQLAADLRTLTSSPAALGLVLAFVAGAVGLVAYFPKQVDAGAAAARADAAPARSLDAEEQNNFEQWYTSLPRVPLTIPTDGAKVLIVKFNDYQCPPCRATYEQYKPIIAKYMAQQPGKVKYLTLDYPLEVECNANVPGSMHASACEAAVAVRLAKAKGRGQAMEEWIFANQPNLTPDLVKEGVRSVAQVTDFDAQYPKVLELVKADIALGRTLNVKGTPTFFINGAQVPIIKPEFFDAAIAYELKK